MWLSTCLQTKDPEFNPQYSENTHMHTYSKNPPHNNENNNNKMPIHFLTLALSTGDTIMAALDPAEQTISSSGQEPGPSSAQWN
jgi:hypothetical protein